jgi:guanine deaminase
LFDFKRADSIGVSWALASDIGAGPFLSMFDVMQSFVAQNRRMNNREATYGKALYRATLKGAELLKLQKQTGNLQPGKWANFIVCDIDFEAKPHWTGEALLREMLNTPGQNRELMSSIVRKTFYKGVEVYSS